MYFYNSWTFYFLTEKLEYWAVIIAEIGLDAIVVRIFILLLKGN